MGGGLYQCAHFRFSEAGVLGGRESRRGRLLSCNCPGGDMGEEICMSPAGPPPGWVRLRFFTRHTGVS